MIKKTKKKLRVPRPRRIHRIWLTDAQVLAVAHVAAAISESVHAGNAAQLEKLREKMSGFPGVWSLCARAALSLQVALIEAGDPQSAEHDFIGCVDQIAEILLSENADFAALLLGENVDWNDSNVLDEKARFVVERNRYKEVNTK